MGHLRRSLAVVAVLVAGASPLAAFQGPVMGPTEPPKTAPAKPAKAKKAPPAKASKANTAKPAEAKKATPSAPKDDKTAAKTKQMLDTGIAAYQAGNENEALRAFNTVIRSGGLASREMAKALYYRGLAYRKKGKPALAIPDLTSAIWLKDGLSATDRQEAMSARAAAYREAGVSDAPQLAQPTGVAATSIGGEGWQAALDAATPVSAPAASTPPHTSASAPVSAPQTAVYEPARPPPPPKSSSSSSSSSGGGFFSSITNLFGGGSSASSNNEVTTSSIVPPPPAPETSAWSEKTEIATASPPQKAAAPTPAAAPTSAPVQRPVPRAAAPAPAPAKSAAFVTQTKTAAVAPPVAPKAAEAPSGKFHVQVAAVRSRSEAYALSVRLLSQHGSELGHRRPQVEPTVMGSMGTFYRVKVGPYATAKESKQLCTSLRASGFDCLVIPQ